jgi:predicted TIM-barrel fold metal-dependent hydrolase
MADNGRVISADGHLEVLPERWTDRVPQKYRDRAPRTVELPNGGQAQMIEGRPLQEAFFLDLRAGRAEGQWQPTGLRVEDSAGTGPPDQRLREQDADGMSAEVLYPAMVSGPGLWRSIRHDEVYKSMVRAYNDWLGEEYAPVNRNRLLTMGVLPWTGVDDCIAEMEHCAKLGLKGVMLGTFPSAKGYPTPEDDKFWAAALDMNMPLTAHVQFDRNGPRASDPTFIYPKNDPEVLGALRRHFLDWIISQGMGPALSISQMVLSGVFDRFPDLKMYFAETRLGWVAFWLEHADLWYRRHLHWAESELGFKPLKALPSEYIREHIYFSIQYERVALENRHHVGVDHIMFATDFPHIECEWPDSQGFIEKLYHDVPEDEKRKILSDNMIKYFHLEDAFEIN